MTKADLTSSVYEKLGFSKRESSEIVEQFFEIVKNCLAQGENVKVSGLGNFVVKHKKARKGRNPQTGEQIEIASRKVMSFKLSYVLKNEINSAKER
jgi:integration host factor subunit alpha